MPHPLYSLFRQPGQSTSEELRGRDFRQELEDKEKEAREKSSKEKRSFTGNYLKS